MPETRLYTGRGKRRPDAAQSLPEVDPEALRDPQDYRSAPDLAAAVETALLLGMPLLLTGEPGSGKLRLAHSVAWELGLGDPLEFVVKSDTQGRDLFYRFDTVGRFHATQTEGAASDPRRFITFEALGKAILHAKSASFALNELHLPASAVAHPGSPRRSVVLIDEIDKAPREVPNDLLVEIENLRFDIPELASVGDTPAVPTAPAARAAGSGRGRARAHVSAIAFKFELLWPPAADEPVQESRLSAPSPQAKPTRDFEGDQRYLELPLQPIPPRRPLEPPRLGATGQRWLAVGDWMTPTLPALAVLAWLLWRWLRRRLVLRRRRGDDDSPLSAITLAAGQDDLFDSPAARTALRRLHTLVAVPTRQLARAAGAGGTPSGGTAAADR